MYFQEFKGINSCIVGLSKLLLEEGVTRQTRGLTAIELDHPIIIKIVNPLARIVMIPERQWNHILPYAESLWLASGRNDMEMIGTYLRKMYDFSDDQKSMRAGYGPRLRYFNGIRQDYETSYLTKKLRHQSPEFIEVDQFEFIEKIFQKDPYTRQAIISITDPAKDYFLKEGELKPTKDFPCTNSLQFLRRGNYLDMITHMRSNDFLWGTTAVNIFNFTFIQEYFAQILGLQVGHYYHIVNNLHYYEPFQSKIKNLAAITAYSDDGFLYQKKIASLEEFNDKLRLLEKYEKELREHSISSLMDFDDQFFNDWSKVFYQFHTGKPVQFLNPILNHISSKRRIFNSI